MIRDLDPEKDSPELFSRIESKFSKIDPEYTRSTWMKIIKAGMGKGFILCDDKTGKIKGGLGCIKAPSFWTEEIRAAEVFLYISPEERGGWGFYHLINAFHDWAKKEGCTKAIIMHYSDNQPEELKRAYEKMGYELSELYYTRKI